MWTALLVPLLFFATAIILCGNAYADDAQVLVTIDSEPRISSIVIDGVIYLPSQLPLQFSWEDGSRHTISLPSTPVYEGKNKRYDFSQWNDQSPSTSRTITVLEDMPLTQFTAIFQPKYLLTILSDYGSPSGGGWYEPGTLAEVRVSPSESIIETVPSKERVVFTGWSTGYKQTSMTNYVGIDGPVVALANWKEQYRLEITGDIATASGAGWYDRGSSARASVPDTVEAKELGKKYVFREWTVSGAGSLSIASRLSDSIEIVMDGPRQLEPQWNKYYYVKIDAGMGNPSGEGYYKEGDLAKITIDPIVETEPGRTRLVLSGWDGINLGALTNSFSTSVDEPINIKPEWTRQYYIKVNSVYGAADGAGWYDEGSQAVVTVQSPSINLGLGKSALFEGWSPVKDNDGTELQYTIDSVRSPQEITALWKVDDTVQAIIVATALAAAVAIAVTTVASKLRTMKNVAGNDRVYPNRRDLSA